MNKLLSHNLFVIHSFFLLKNIYAKATFTQTWIPIIMSRCEYQPIGKPESVLARGFRGKGSQKVDTFKKHLS